MTKSVSAPVPLYTVKEAARILNTCERTVRRLIKSKQLPIVRLGRLIRIDPDDLSRCIAANRYA